MPQDSLRSAVYRSFVTCDDPKGVVECRTIRKSKSGSQKLEHKNKSRRTPKNSNTTLAHKAEKEEMVSKEITEEFRSPSSLQLLEVSGRAQNLNQMIDSWSKGQDYDGQSKDIAKDLMKGALDLQDSLIMLGKLQEASHYMAQLEKIQKKSERGRLDEVGIERTNSSRFGDQKYQMGFQKPRLSTDGSSRDCFEELRKVIGDSLARQNLLPNKTIEENTCFHRRNWDSASEIASTSSSQSSIQTNNFSSTDSPLSSAAPKKKVKGTNLIAKLMGLEEIPSKSLQTTPQKQVESKKISNQQRPVFDIDRPKVRKPQFVAPKESPERRTLEEILDVMQVKGLLKSNSVKEHKSHSHHANDSHFKQSLVYDTPPIVLIKPWRFPCLESEEPLGPWLRDERVLNTNMMQRKLKVKEKPPSKAVDCKEWAVNSNKMSRKLEADETPIKKLSQEGDRREVVVRPEEKIVMTKQKGSSKMKASGSVSQQPQKKDSIHRKSDKIPKEVASSRNPAEKEIVKSKSMPRSQDQDKVTTTKQRKPENGSNITRNHVPRQRTSTPNTISKHTTQSIIHNSSGRKSLVRKEKPVSEPTVAKLNTENLGCKEDDKKINLTCENVSVLIGNNTTLASQLPTVKQTDAYVFQIGEHCNNSQSSLCDVGLRTSECERDPKSVEEDNDHISHVIPDNKNFKPGNNLKALLSSSPAFLSHVEELFDLNVNGPTILHTFGNEDIDVSNMKLSMDCANELIELRSFPDSQTVHPLLLIQAGNWRISISLDQLLEEVCDKVETLINISKLAANILPVDGVYAMLDRDIKSKGVLSGTWDLGWKYGFSVDDAEKVVSDMEKQLLSGLIEEIFA